MVWLEAGKHLYRLQDDVLEVQLHGTLELPDAQWLLGMLYELVQVHGYSLMLADVRQGVSIPPQVRQWIGTWHKTHSAADGSAVVVGAGAVFRTLLTMINGAVRLLGLPTGDLVFAKSESEAWETVAERRTRWRERTQAKRAEAAKPL